jgi:hypothetical protein
MSLFLRLFLLLKLELAQTYEVRPCPDRRGVDLISDVLPFGRLGSGKVTTSLLLPSGERRTSERFWGYEANT